MAEIAFLSYRRETEKKNVTFESCFAAFLSYISEKEKKLSFLKAVLQSTSKDRGLVKI